jgi:hypothetical protein
MKLFSGWMISAGLVLSAAAAHAQVLPPHPIGGPHAAVVSDFEGPPYGAMPQDAPPPRPGYGYGYGPNLLPMEEVYAVVRENGFSPLGIPRQRGLVYTIAVVDRGGDDGRLVIDARNGQILRFMPAGRLGFFNPGEDSGGAYGPAGAYGSVGPLPPVSAVRGPPRPPGNIPHVASRTPVPKAAPPRAGDMMPEAAVRPAPPPPQQSAAMQAKPATPPTETTGSVPAKPAPQILPTQPMPQAQGLD